MPLTTEQDALGTDRYVKGLKNFISNSTTPITIALQGEWGSGKTSLMNRLQNELCSVDDDFIGVTVNTWEYSMLSSSGSVQFISTLSAMISAYCVISL